MPAVNTRRYFAYGSNMDRAQMRHRCPGAVVVGTARLRGHRFLINRRGVASVVPAVARDVYGVLWDIPLPHERALDNYEGIAVGWYYKTVVEVEALAGDTQSALIYIACEQVEGLSRHGYMQRIVAAAEDFSLPQAYVRELRAWLPQRG
jgi:cation transport regulator ChaC